MKKTTITSLVVSALIATAAVLPIAPLAQATPGATEVTYRYYAMAYEEFTEPTPCYCVVGPCAPENLVGEKTVYCDGTSESFGYTDRNAYCFTRVERITGAACPQ